VIVINLQKEEGRKEQIRQNQRMAAIRQAELDQKKQRAILEK
jgi:hypothetical protein